MKIKMIFKFIRLLQAWYAKMESYMFSHEFVHCKSKPNFYTLRTAYSLLLLVMYVNDFLITGYSTSLIVVVKMIMHDRFLMMDMGPLHFFLGLEISQDAS
jgi:hypothetical protein